MLLYLYFFFCRFPIINPNLYLKDSIRNCDNRSLINRSGDNQNLINRSYVRLIFLMKLYEVEVEVIIHRGRMRLRL